MCISVELDDAVDYSDRINIYNEGVITSYQSGSAPYDKIKCEWKELINGAHIMPAYGVSLNHETLKALESGLWVEFLFDCIYESNGMPYEKLLINVEKNFQGFNIIRYSTEYGYDGRCFYYDLVNKNMSNFYEILINL